MAKKKRGFKFDWERKLAECRLGPATKSVGLWLSHHANHDGTNAHPGVALLAHESETSERTVRRCLEKLRATGLIVRVVEGSTAEDRNWADEYNLAIPGDLETHVRVEPKRDHRKKGHGRSGVANHARWHIQRGKFDPFCVHCTEAEGAEAGFRPEAQDRTSTSGPSSDHRPNGVRTTGQTESDQRTPGIPHQAVTTTKLVPHHSSHPSAAERTSSPGLTAPDPDDPIGIRAYVLARFNNKLNPAQIAALDGELRKEDLRPVQAIINLVHSLKRADAA